MSFTPEQIKILREDDGRAAKRKPFGGAFREAKYEKIRWGGKARLRLSASVLAEALTDRSDGQAGGQKFLPPNLFPFCPPAFWGCRGFAPDCGF